MKIKPQIYNGSDDLDEYLTQFNIVAELNNWDYETKSLYLASSLNGNARAILCELDSQKRKSFEAIVHALQNRYGSVHRAEIYRSKLQTRTLQKHETLPELAQSVRKLTRQAYPSAATDVLELLAMEHFIDALPDTDIRLRLREVGPKSISEAEKIAVRLDAHKIADRNRGKYSVRSVFPEENKTDRKLNELSYQMEKLAKEVQGYQSMNLNRGLRYRNTYQNPHWQSTRGSNNFARNNTRNHTVSRPPAKKGENEVVNSGNAQSSGLRTETQQVSQGPLQKN
jgi:hypothetical protein